MDFTNPKICKWYQGRPGCLTDMGVDYFKTDFRKRTPVIGVVYYDRPDAVEMYNYYTYPYN